jgi:hypothetical protein
MLLPRLKPPLAVRFAAVPGALYHWIGCLGVSLAAVATPRAARGEDPVSGTWKVLVEERGQAREYYLEVTQKGKDLTGTFVSPRSGKFPFTKGSYAAGKLSVSVPRRSGDATRVYEIAAEVKAPGRLEGVLRVDGQDRGTAIVTPVPDPVGEWQVVTKSPDGDNEYRSTLTVRADGNALKGSSATQLGDFALDAVAVKDGKLVFEITLPIDGNDVPFVVTAAFHAPNALSGTWKVRDADFSGAWHATREPAVAAAAAEAAPLPSAAAAASVLGRWQAETRREEGDVIRFRLELEAAGGGASGKVHFPRGSATLEDLKLETRSFRCRFRYVNDEGTQVDLEGELDGADVLRGRWTTPGGDGGTFAARRTTLL